MTPLELLCVAAERFATVRALYYAVVEDKSGFLVVFWNATYYMYSPIVSVGRTISEADTDEMIGVWGKYWSSLLLPYFVQGGMIDE